MTARSKARKVAQATIGNRFAPPRFLLFLALLPIGFAALMLSHVARDWKDALAVAFDGAALVFLVSLWPILHTANSAEMREHAAANDANRPLVLAITSLLTLVVMAAISGELEAIHHGSVAAIVKLVATLLLIWLFANTVYAVHYAHAFYSQAPADGGDCGGIDFPGTRTPDYWDFAYFSFTLGMTFQTSDVNIPNHRIRRVVLFHSFAAFLFNIGVIAFTINSLGGAGGSGGG